MPQGAQEGPHRRSESSEEAAGRRPLDPGSGLRLFRGRARKKTGPRGPVQEDLRLRRARRQKFVVKRGKILGNVAGIWSRKIQAHDLNSGIDTVFQKKSIQIIGLRSQNPLTKTFLGYFPNTFVIFIEDRVQVRM